MQNIHLHVKESYFPKVTFKKYRYLGLGILLGLSLFYLFRSCGLPIFIEKDYYISQSIRWRELELMGKERNLSAFNNELLKTLATQEKFHVHLSSTTDPISDLEQGKLQGALTTVQSSYLNVDRFLFSETYFLTGPVLITSLSEDVDGWNEKRKKIIGIPRRSPLFSTLEKDSNLQIKIYDDILTALADLQARRIDGAIFPVIPAYTYTQTFYKNELKIATLPLNDEGIRLVAMKNEVGETLIKKFNEGLKELKDNGTYNEMLKRWGFINVEQLAS